MGEEGARGTKNVCEGGYINFLGEFTVKFSIVQCNNKNSKKDVQPYTKNSNRSLLEGELVRVSNLFRYDPGLTKIYSGSIY